MQAKLRDQIERLAIKDIGRINDGRRIAVRGISGCQCPPDLTGTHRVHEHPVAPRQVENRQIGTCLLCESNRVKGPEVVDPLEDLGGVVDVGRRTKLTGKSDHRNAADLGAERGKLDWRVHEEFPG